MRHGHELEASFSWSVSSAQFLPENLHLWGLVSGIPDLCSQQGICTVFYPLPHDGVSGRIPPNSASPRRNLQVSCGFLRPQFPGEAWGRGPSRPRGRRRGGISTSLTQFLMGAAGPRAGCSQPPRPASSSTRHFTWGSPRAAR